MVIEQRLPKRIVDNFIEALKTEHGAILNMESVDIGLSDGKTSDQLIKLPIWGYVELRRTTDFVFAMQDIHLSLNAAVSTSSNFLSPPKDG